MDSKISILRYCSWRFGVKQTMYSEFYDCHDTA